MVFKYNKIGRQDQPALLWYEGDCAVGRLVLGHTLLNPGLDGTGQVGALLHPEPHPVLADPGRQQVRPDHLGRVSQITSSNSGNLVTSLSPTERV